MVLTRIRRRLLAPFTARRQQAAEARDQARDQRAALEALHLRQLDLLQRARIEAVQAMEARRRIEAEVQHSDEAAEAAARDARVAANVESDEHVRGLLRQEQAARGRSAELAPTLDRLREQEGLLSTAIEGLAAKVAAFADRKEGLLARTSTADAAAQLAAKSAELQEQSDAIDAAVNASKEAAARLMDQAVVAAVPIDPPPP